MCLKRLRFFCFIIGCNFHSHANRLFGILDLHNRSEFTMNIFIKKSILSTVLLILAHFLPSQASSDLYLKDKMQQAKTGDYIVASINNCYNVLLIRKRLDDYMSIEEITAPNAKLRSS